jgi:hypothetical protein
MPEVISLAGSDSDSDEQDAISARIQAKLIWLDTA